MYIGTQASVESYVKQKVSVWVNAVEHLSSIAHTQPHAAYAAFTHGLMSKWTYLTRAIPNIGDLLSPLKDIIRQKPLPSLTGQNAFNDVTRDLMALPVRLGGLGITNPSADTPFNHDASMKITAPLTALIMDQSPLYSNTTKVEQLRIKKESMKAKKHHQLQAAAELKEKLPNNLQRATNLLSEKGSSSWLSVLPIADHGFALHKSAFRDALCLRYNWHPSNMPLHCTCGKQFLVDHALSRPHGGFPSICHNELRDITAELSEVCHNVGTEPPLLQVTGEHLIHQTANSEDGARLDVAAESFGQATDNAHFSTYGFSTLSRKVTAMPPWLKRTAGTSWRRKEPMIRE